MLTAEDMQAIAQIVSATFACSSQEVELLKLRHRDGR